MVAGGIPVCDSLLHPIAQRSIELAQPIEQSTSVNAQPRPPSVAFGFLYGRTEAAERDPARNTPFGQAGQTKRSRNVSVGGQRR
jgi:hypothetical protein